MPCAPFFPNACGVINYPLMQMYSDFTGSEIDGNSRGSAKFPSTITTRQTYLRLFRRTEA